MKILDAGVLFLHRLTLKNYEQKLEKHNNVVNKPVYTLQQKHQHKKIGKQVNKNTQITLQE